MNLLKSQNRIVELMERFVNQVKKFTVISRTDINKVAETIIIPLFAEIYAYKNLENLNYTKRTNYEGIDLGDETARVAFQITSTSGSEKIKDTLEKFVDEKYKLYEKYDRLIIYILTEKKKNQGSGHKEIIQGKFQFDKDKDIIDYQDLLKEISNLQIDKVRKIESILEANFGETRTAPEREVADKVQQIINENIKLFVGRSEEINVLDNFLSKNSNRIKLVIGGAGFGKTSLLANWIKSQENKKYFIAYHFFSQRYEVTRSVKNAYRHLLQQLYTYYDELIYQQLPNDEQQLRETLYYLLRQNGARKDKPLVIVIDSLDEAANPFEPPFPTPLPENVFVIVSARAEEGEKPEYLSGWIDNGEPISLNRLPKEAIADWLKKSGEGELAILADDIQFVNKLDEITQGFPLYLKYLTDDLCYTAKQGKNVWEVLTRTPQGFDQYVKQQLKYLDKFNLPDERWQFFALLAVAKGTLEKEDVKELTRMRDRHLRQLEQCWQVTRWIKISEDKLYAFAHPLLGITFANQLDDEAEDALEVLIKYCRNWQENQSRYALRHYAEHLRDQKLWEDLYVIARNKTFASCQQKNLPDQPDLPLKTIQIALLGAAEEDKAGEMAEFLLIHAQQLIETISEDSPLDAMRKGSLNRALDIADLYEIERCILWYLLLVWELKDTGKLADARATLDRLQQKELPCFEIRGDADWQCDFAAYFLAHDFEISDSVCEVLGQKLNDRYQRILSIYLSDFNNFTAAINILLKTKSDIQQIVHLIAIAKAQSERGDITAAATFDKALEMIRKNFPSHSHNWFYVMIMIGEKQGEVGNKEAMLATFTEVYDSAKTITNSSQLNPELEDLEKKIAIIKAGGEIPREGVDTEIHSEANQEERLNQLKYRLNTSQVSNSDKNEILFEIAGLYSDIKEQYDKALEYAARINNPDRLATIQGLIAKGQAKSSQTAARTTFATAIQMAQGYQQYELAFLQASELVNIAELEINKGLKQIDSNIVTIAYNVAQNINILWQQVNILARVAEVLAKFEKDDEAKEIFDQAIQISQKIERQQERVYSFQIIALAQARIKYFSSACQTANKIEFPWTKSEVIEKIAKLQAESGQREEAQKTLYNASQMPLSMSEGNRFIEGKRINIICTEVVLESVINYKASQEKLSNLLKFARESGKQRDVNLLTIVTAFVEIGSIPTAFKIIDEMDDAWEQVRALWVITCGQYQKQEKVTTLNAILKCKEKIDNEKQRMESLKIIASVQVLVGLGEQAVRTIEAILTERNRQIPQIASHFVYTGDHSNFKKILLPCAYYIDAAYEMCGYLAKLYPEQASSVARVISERI
ncbi:MAG: ATP-binding protein [Dolichospermum sp. DEX182a]|nr:ATP-binding protein [Dolichospermum sp. DEX182a]